MKKKNPSDQPIIVSILSNALTRASDKQDKKLNEALKKQNKDLAVTLDKRDKNLFAFMKAEIVGAIYESEVRLKDEFTNFANKLFTKIDPVLKEVVNAREDRVLASDEAEEFKKKLGNHEKRIIKLEEN